MAADDKDVADSALARRRGFSAAVCLVAIAVLGAGLIGITERLTEDRVAANRSARVMETLAPLLATVDYDNEPHLDNVSVIDAELLGSKKPQLVYRARRGSKVVASIISATAPTGYVGPILLEVATDANGKILGVQVLEHQETPGLGDKIEAQKTPWINVFAGRSLSNPNIDGWTTKSASGEFDQITGATITSRAVVLAVRDALIFLQQNSETVLAPSPADEAPQ